MSSKIKASIGGAPIASVSALFACEEIGTARGHVVRGMGPCNICNCRGYKGISAQWCESCKHSPMDHA